MENNLIDLIKEYGEPDALIDHWETDNLGYAIWGYEDTIEWNHLGIIKSGKTHKASLGFIQDAIEEWKKNTSDIAGVGFISCNFKEILYKHISFKNSNPNFPYLFFGKPKLIKKYKIEVIDSNIPSMRLKKDVEKYKKYENKINKIKLELEKGNVYQINYTSDKSYSLNNSPLELYLYLRNKSKPKYGYYVKYNNIYILSFSPELFFKKEKNIIQSSPMKGTIKRSENFDYDNQLKFELKNSIKDRAEHLMIVDLLRNDIGKIAIPGTVKVDEIFKVESHKTVHQMISNITAELDVSVKEVDIISALFPGGSITGAPKESAMKIIDNLEDYNRDIYTGTIGYIESNGNLNFNIAIRTMTIKNNKGVYPVGGGIVWDSNAIDEWNEAQLKSKILNQIIL